VAWVWTAAAIVLLLLLAYIAWEFRWYWASLRRALVSDEDSNSETKPAVNEPALPTRQR
jgi:hypothetical protein